MEEKITARDEVDDFKLGEIEKFMTNDNKFLYKDYIVVILFIVILSGILFFVMKFKPSDDLSFKKEIHITSHEVSVMEKGVKAKLKKNSPAKQDIKDIVGTTKKLDTELKPYYFQVITYLKKSDAINFIKKHKKQKLSMFKSRKFFIVRTQSFSKNKIKSKKKILVSELKLSPLLVRIKN